MRFNFRSLVTSDSDIAFPIYVSKPPIDRFLNKILRGLPYIIFSAIGVDAAIHGDQPFNVHIYDWLFTLNSYLIAFTAVLCLIAVVIKSIRLEYGVIWFLAGCFSVLMWPMWFSERNGSLALLSFTFLIYRGFRLSLEVRANTILRKKELNALSLMEEEESERRADSGGS